MGECAGVEPTSILWYRNPVFKHSRVIMNNIVLRRMDSNHRPLGYEPSELPLLHSAILWVLVDLNH